MEPMFMDAVHEDFYVDMMLRAARSDTYHQALFYTLGLTEDTRRNINSLYDFGEHCISFGGLHQGWQIGTSRRVCNFAFNLFNGYCGDEDNNAKDFTPENLFCCGLQKYMFEAVRLRYPEYYH